MGKRMRAAVTIAASIGLAFAGAVPAFATGTSDTSRQTLGLFVIGDSYSAGNGTSGGTTSASEKAKIQAISGIANPGGYTGSYVDAKGRTVDSMRSQLNYGGQAKAMLASRGVHVAYANYANSGSTIKGSGPGSIINQVAAVPTNADVVAFTAGGNDVHFTTIVENCFTVGLRSPKKCRSAVDAASAGLDAVIANTTDVFTALENRIASGRTADVMLMAYPLLSLDLPDYALSSGSDSYPAATKVRELGRKAIAMQRRLVQTWNAAGHNLTAHFVDSYVSVFAGHEPDPRVGKNDHRWINEFWETRGFTDADSTTNSSASTTMANFYHPNVSGHHAMATGLVDAITAAGSVNTVVDASAAPRMRAPGRSASPQVSRAPFAWVDGPYAVRAGETLGVDASASWSAAPITGYDWDFDGDGVMDARTADAHATHLYDAPGDYTLRVCVTDANGRSAVTTTQVEVRTPAQDEAAAGSDSDMSAPLDRDAEGVRESM